MKIKDFRKPKDYFGNIEPGTVFVVDNNVYMAIPPIEEKELGMPLNAVNLETGGLTYYFGNTAIQIVDAELCVR